MDKKLRCGALLVALAAMSACGLEDLTPTTARLRLQGGAGTQVTVVYSTTFQAGVDEDGVTRVLIFDSDSVTVGLPTELTVDIVENRQVFFQVLPVDAEIVTLQAVVDIDGRVQVDESGDVHVSDPWRYVYVFNQLLTRTIDVVI